MNGHHPAQPGQRHENLPVRIAHTIEHDVHVAGHAANAAVKTGAKAWRTADECGEVVLELREHWKAGKHGQAIARAISDGNFLRAAWLILLQTGNREHRFSVTIGAVITLAAELRRRYAAPQARQQGTAPQPSHQPNVPRPRPAPSYQRSAVPALWALTLIQNDKDWPLHNPFG